MLEEGEGEEMEPGSTFLLLFLSPAVKETPASRLRTVLCKIGSAGESCAPAPLAGMHTPGI